MAVYAILHKNDEKVTNFVTFSSFLIKIAYMATPFGFEFWPKAKIGQNCSKWLKMARVEGVPGTSKIARGGGVWGPPPQTNFHVYRVVPRVLTTGPP